MTSEDGVMTRARLTAAVQASVLVLALVFCSGAWAATIESPRLEVLLDDAFPQVVQYRWKDTGAIIHDCR